MATGPNLWPEDSDSPFGEVFSEGTPTLPHVLVVDDPAALIEHARKGTLELRAIDRRYGKHSFWSTKKILLPPLDNGADESLTFHMEGDELVPPENPTRR